MSCLPEAIPAAPSSKTETSRTLLCPPCLETDILAFSEKGTPRIRPAPPETTIHSLDDGCEITRERLSAFAETSRNGFVGRNTLG